ncbi:MAG: LCCL domain-containing protein [Pirellulales bacterium]|nr:LCCL domain-containing protein [Pirellulales bacterium]
MPAPGNSPRLIAKYSWVMSILTVWCYGWTLAAFGQQIFLAPVAEDPFGEPQVQRPAVPSAESKPEGELAIPPPAAVAGQLRASFADQGQLTLHLLDEKLELETPFGTLAIPVAEIRQIEFGLRITPAIQEKLSAALANLASENFNKREAGGKTLLELGAAAYPDLVKLCHSPDAETATRAKELIAKLEETLPASRLQPRANDVVTTGDSIITGKIKAETFKVRTSQFGEQELKLADLRRLSTRGLEGREIPRDVTDDPGNLVQFQQQIGKTLYFKVTGQAQGYIWGTGSYTTDSRLATAAIHAGALRDGETGVVKVKIVPSPAQFIGSTQNGVSSYPYPQYTAAYQVSKVRGNSDE